jgi:hypothetical protein
LDNSFLNIQNGNQDADEPDERLQEKINAGFDALIAAVRDPSYLPAEEFGFEFMEEEQDVVTIDSTSRVRLSADRDKRPRKAG